MTWPVSQCHINNLHKETGDDPRRPTYITLSKLTHTTGLKTYYVMRIWVQHLYYYLPWRLIIICDLHDLSDSSVEGKKPYQVHCYIPNFTTYCILCYIMSQCYL